MKKSCLLFCFVLLIFSCKKDESDPPTVLTCLLDNKTPSGDAGAYYDSFYRFRVGNSWTYEVKYYRADTLFDSTTVTNTITGYYFISDKYWWEFNGSKQTVLKTDSTTLIEPFTAIPGDCPVEHASFIFTSSDTVYSNYVTGSTTYPCYFVPCTDTVINPGNTFYPTVKRYSAAFNQPVYYYFAPAVGMVYSLSFPNASDTTRYTEARLISYTIN